MTIKRVQAAARKKGLYFDGVKRWQNSDVGYGYSIVTWNGSRWLQADTLVGMYRLVKAYKE